MSEKQKKRWSIVPGRSAYDRRVTPSQLRVLVALGTYTDDHGWCYPQQATIAADLGMSRTTVARSIASLAKMNPPYVQAERRVARGRGLRGLWYRVILDTVEQPQALVALCSNEHTGKGREQNGEVEPLCANEHTGAGVLAPTTAVCSNGHTGYIAEGSQEKEYPYSPRKRGRTARKPQRTRSDRVPQEFDAAWTAWPKAGSSKIKALAAWRNHRATAARKLAAVRAYLASSTAQAKGGQYVPYFQRWLADSLGSYLDIADRKSAATASALAVQIAAPDVPEWKAALPALRATFGEAEFASYWGRCVPLCGEPLTIAAGSKYAAEKMQREHAPRAQKMLHLHIVVVGPDDERAAALTGR